MSELTVIEDDTPEHAKTARADLVAMPRECPIDLAGTAALPGAPTGCGLGTDDLHRPMRVFAVSHGTEVGASAPEQA
ncbi:hypothetical protein [Palleronia sp. LCG004]|uniref:hypothetical protein n=1 Tax=Palleronia sp. LCG004 TaxID=3079304 RepID=UPI0029433A34|nr:hypothetical protein [Palleronia sp. LCG004]WOI56682.1 hypothetical protein RVY76_02455 [Palleronia sp. LCG004]